MTKQSRRQFLGTCSALLGMGLTSTGAGAAESGSALRGGRNTFRYCLNTSTVRGQKLGLVKEIELAAGAGYQAIEPWVRDVQAYVEQGGSLRDLAKRVRDTGLTVESAIGFAQWIVDDPAQRAKGLEQAKRDMDLVAQLGGKRLAAPPAGATRGALLDLMEIPWEVFPANDEEIPEALGRADRRRPRQRLRRARHRQPARHGRRVVLIGTREHADFGRAHR
ncbi:MAG: TIM barrel protein, partial [Planctomycetes bacterium]|nr:TIM barrel protein [Planctomycetota bacterium]